VAVLIATDCLLLITVGFTAKSRIVRNQDAKNFAMWPVICEFLILTSSIAFQLYVTA
jgi:hypothetical protein